jgi:hypothetical protein
MRDKIRLYISCLYKLLAVQYGTIFPYYVHAENRECMTAFDRQWI